MSATENKAIVDRFINELISNDRRELIEELVAEDYVYRGGNGEEYRGRQGFQEVLDTYRNAFPDLELNVTKMVAEGDVVATWYTFGGTHRGELEGIQPTDRNVSSTSVQFLTIRNGQIVEEWDLVDQLTLLQKLGAVEIHQEPSRRQRRAGDN